MMNKIFNEIQNSDQDFESLNQEIQKRLRHGKKIFFDHQAHVKAANEYHDDDILNEFFIPLGDYDIECLQEYSEHYSGLGAVERERQLQIYQEENIPSIVTPTKTSYQTLNEIIDEYLVIKRLKHLRPSTILGIQQTLEIFSQAIGNLSVTDIDDSHIRIYQHSLAKLPKNMNKNPSLKGMSFKQKISSGTETISNQTIINNAKKVQEFLRWAYDQHYFNRDHSTILKGIAKKTKKANENIDRFTLEELEKIFGVSEFHENVFVSTPYRYWIPLIGLYTGARLNEICQLLVSDVKSSVDNIWYFDFSDEGQGFNENGSPTKNFKNKSSRRSVPIHNKLIQLGFIEYHQQCVVKNQHLLFDDLIPNRDGKYFRKVSDFFNSTYKGVGLLRYAGIDKVRKNGSKLNFHSFRNTLRDELKQKLMEVPVVNEIMGHEHSDTGNRVYSHGYSLKHKQKTLNKIKFEFTHPKKWSGK